MTKRRERVWAFVAQLGFLVLLVAWWQWAAMSDDVSSLLLPPPGDVLAQLRDVIVSGEFLQDLVVSLRETTIAFAIAVFAGMVSGFIFSRTTYRVRVFDPLLSALYAIPTVLFYPLFLLSFGIGEGSKIAVGTLMAFFPIALNTMAGFASVEKIHLTASQAMGARPFVLLRYVLVPAAAPIIVAGLRIGFILAFLSILGSESITSLAGLGHRIVALAESLEIARMYAYIVIAIATAATLNLAANAVTRTMGPR